MGFTLKKIIGSLLMPLPLFFLACLFAIVLFKRGRIKLAKGLLVFSVSCLYLFSIQPVAHFLASPLEMAYPKYNYQDVQFVAVLGGYHKSDERQPITSLLSVDSLNRLNEGIRIVKQNPEAKLLLSGSKDRDDIAHAEAMAQVAEMLGISRSSMILFTEAKDTDDEARHWASLTKGQDLALVTSATHMPRAMRLFTKYGIKPIPAPTGHRTTGQQELNWKSFMPRAFHLDLAAKAWHEYIGIVWATLRS